MVKFNSKSQVALEFVTTYLWAIIVIIILVAAFMYFGILNPKSFLAERCIISHDIECVQYIIGQTDAGTGVLRLRLKNNFPESIIVASWDTTSEASTPFSCTEKPATGIWLSQETRDVEFTGCNNEDAGLVLREKGKVDVIIDYYPATATSQYSKELQGEIFATVTTVSGLLTQPECNDDTDNDGNGCIDWIGGDTGCDLPSDLTESGGFCPGGDSDPGGGDPSDPLDCYVSTNCLDTVVFKMSALEDAHAEIPSGINYNYKACCRTATDTLTTDCSDSNPLDLSANSDAHVAVGSLDYFGVPVCLSANTGTVSCSAKANCDADETCLATVSSITIDAHVADCSTNPYTNKICCKII